MSEIVGITSYNILNDIKKGEIEKMLDAISGETKDKSETFYSLKAILGLNKLNKSNADDLQLLTRYDCQRSYTIVLDGTIYNKTELRNKLTKYGFIFKTNNDSEVVLNAFIHYKEKCLNLFKGVFCFAIWNGNSLFLARDKLGVKPLYYTIFNNKFLFSSKINAFFAYKDNKPIINKDGFLELYGLGPMMSEGKTPFKNVFSLKPGEYLRFINNRIEKIRYYVLPTKKLELSFDEAKIKVGEMINNIIHEQLANYDTVSSFLSGGLDSSIVSKVLADKRKINTYFLDYQDNDKNFEANTFQHSRDIDTSRLMSHYLSSNHHELVIDSNILFDHLIPSMHKRDMPGMADIDSSLYWMAKTIAKKDKIVFSGECADEIFGGYPWCYRNEKDINIFPWHRNIDQRIDLLKAEYQNLGFKEYVKNAYDEALKNIEYLSDEDAESRKWRKTTYLNIYWFMQQLLIRNYSQTSDLEVVVPFADVELAELAYNLPPSYKYQQESEKFILREVFKDELPLDIIFKKKNPYPKTYDPNYFDLVAGKVKEILEDETSILNKLFDKDKIISLTNRKDNKSEIPWFGQLMTTPQLLGYLIQLHYWQKDYNITFEL